MMNTTPAHGWRRLAGWGNGAAAALLLAWLAFGLRVFRLGHQELRGDEGFSYLLIRDGLWPALERVLAVGEPSQPLHLATLALARQLWGDSEFALRFASVLIGVLAVPLVWQLGRRLLGNAAALWAAGLLVVNPFMVWYAQDARNMYVYMVLFSALAALGLLRAVEARDLAGARRGWALYAVAGALGVYAHYYAALGLLASGLWVLLRRRQPAGGQRLGGQRSRGRQADGRPLAGWALASLALVALVLPWAAWHIPAIIARGPVGGGVPEPLPGLIGRLGRVLLWGGFLAPPDALTLALAVGLAGMGLTLAWRRSRDHALWLALVALLPPVLAIAIAQRRTLFNEGYMLSALPALLVLAGAAFAARPVLRAAGVAFVAVLFLALGNYYFDPRYSRSTGWRVLATRVAAETTARDVVVANVPDPTLYYYVRGPAEAVVLPPAPDADPATVAAVLGPVAARGGQVWFLPSSWDVHGLVRGYLDAGWLLVDEGWTGRQHLFVYASPARAQADAQPVGAVLGDQMRLRAYLAQPRAAPGGRLHLILFWEALSPVARDYTVFTHLLAPDGTLAAQHDNPPADGTRPTSSWRLGEVVTDTHALELPASLAPGDYTLQAGLYDPATGTRLAVTGGGAAVRLATLSVR